ncbi:MULTISPECIES: LPS export ABC transporter ATP-binding protein [unclassified Hydrogenobaculum]|jgi:ABC-type (unclassified) transport system, ATPase component|uniref:LPS export ABC transporter ATP-binding protein n=1 Tax=unclassified Hydrogenobaculum TaxID=2622382 RepID=UPI0001C52554|nr:MULTISPECIES: LPS export ABC transporter ATP-binding protein [unclassified Hydrogenobaculum]AEF18705.1 Sulfate-transporting ATPase [Hydrogenobaculum sp. 3684]AEG45993.1 Sulfate-transporting ATPase [Hydrogenobaculum sp. SHO]AGG14636.1 ABC transporter related protein [Hydrogenobaculum sp. HO]AGH92935.1 ABC-type (unclassified) transport system, ATPase component [Hydrogenobaculum sp. SN]
MIEVSNISKSIKNNPIISDVSLQINPGEIIGLMGPNGAGKTTIFNAISGFIKVDKGTIKIDDQEVTHYPPYKRAKFGLSFLPQEHSLFEEITTWDNMLMFADFIYKNKKDAQNISEELLQHFGLLEHKDKKAGELSGGMKRKLEVARCLLIEPSYIMLDEPFAGVDPVAISDIKRMLLDLKEKNIGILITDHNVFELLRLIDRGYIINHGSVLAEGTPKDLLKNNKVREVYIGYEIEL